MKLLKKYGIQIFWTLLLLDAFLDYNKSLEHYRIFTKPFLLIVLTAYFWLNTKRGSRHSKSKSRVYAALAVCWVGDLFLLNNELNSGANDNLIILGLLFNLTGFVIYIFIYTRMCAFDIKDCQEGFLGFLATTVISLIFYRNIRVEEMSIFYTPIIVAGIIISILLVTFSANNLKDKQRKAVAIQYLLPGSIMLVLFLGFTIAYRFFLHEADFVGIVITLTYGFGQLLLIRAFLKYLKG